MAVVVEHPVLDESALPIEGRPDFADWTFGVTLAKRFPPYVFSVRGVSCLVHKIQRVELHWWCIGRGGHALFKLKRPVMVAHTNCAQNFRLEGAISRTCAVPAPDALLCGRCHGEGPTFPKQSGRRSYRAPHLTRQEAHVRLGCAIQGY